MEPCPVSGAALRGRGRQAGFQTSESLLSAPVSLQLRKLFNQLVYHRYRDTTISQFTTATVSHRNIIISHFTRLHTDTALHWGNSLCCSHSLEIGLHLELYKSDTITALLLVNDHYWEFSMTENELCWQTPPLASYRKDRHTRYCQSSSPQSLAFLPYPLVGPAPPLGTLSLAHTLTRPPTDTIQFLVVWHFNHFKHWIQFLAIQTTQTCNSGRPD